MTTSAPTGRSTRTSRLTERKRRRTRLRVTALPTDFVTIKPKRLGSEPGRSRTWSTAPDVPTLRPRRTAVRKSTGRVTRFALASTRKYYADSSVRPLRRRAPRMARPARVRMRRRKPCTLERRRLFGWKVLLLIAVSPKPSSEGRKEVVSPKAGSQLIKSTALNLFGQTLGASRRIIHIRVSGVGNDTLWRTKVNPSRFRGPESFPAGG
jgi:hypothetical protein